MAKHVEKEKSTKEERGDMAVLAKPVNKISVIREQDSRKFVRDFNANKVSEEFLDSCKKAGVLFGRKK